MKGQIRRRGKNSWAIAIYVGREESDATGKEGKQ